MDYPIRTLEQLQPILRGLRKQANLTQAQVASLLNITQQSYAKIEANPAATSVDRLFTILRLLGAEINLHQSNLLSMPNPEVAEQYVARHVPNLEKAAKFTRIPTARSQNTTTPPPQSKPKQVKERTKLAAPAKLIPPSGKKETW